MRLYVLMQNLKWPRSYVGRILLLCFGGTHIPLLALLIWLVVTGETREQLGILAVGLVATLVGTAFTFYGMLNMLSPVLKATAALEHYAAKGSSPNLPVGYRDEAGRLMASVQSTLSKLDGKIDELTEISVTDPLTGARNRRWLNEVGIPHFESLRIRGGTISLLIIDLDGFKQLNDTCGHSSGDQVLITVSDAIRQAIRPEDIVVRVGGDEFCVFLPNAGHGILTSIGEAIRRESEEMLTTLPAEYRITLSLGGATLRRDDTGFTDLYRRADQNLYSAKQAGRNRLVAW